MKYVLQHHGTNATACHDTAVMQVIALHGNRADGKHRYVSENAKESHLYRLPK